MGNWFETCAISNLPIQDGDKVKIFFIKKKDHIYEEWSGCGEPDKWYAPYDVPVDAYCDSEEKFRLEKTGSSSRIMEAQRSSKENYDMMIIRKSMYEIIINEMKTRKNLYHTLQKEADEFIEKMKTIDPMHVMFGYETSFPGNRFVRFFDETSRGMKNLLKKLSETDSIDLKQGMIEIILFHYGLKVMRKMWHPGVGRGSQDTEYFLHKKIAEEVLRIEQKVKNDWLEENELDEDENEDDITKMYMWYL